VTLTKLVGLYYPHSHVHDEKILKTALLLWDKLELIVPAHGYQAPEPPPYDVAEALEIVGVEHVVTDEEKLLAHKEIMQLVEKPLTEWLLFDVKNPDTTYAIYEPKLLDKTWAELQHAELVTPVGRMRGGAFKDWAAHKSLGLTIMGILTEVCAGTQRRTITDRDDAYAAYTRATTFVMNGDYEFAPPLSTYEATDTTVRLTTIAAKMVDADLLTLRDLIDLRKREANEKNFDLRKLRQNFAAKIDEQVQAVTTSKTTRDREEIIRKFEMDVEQDLSDLNRELAGHDRRVILTESVLLGVAAMAAIPTLALGGAPGMWTALQPQIGVGLIPKLAETLFSYREKRLETMNKHAMAWLQRAVKES
jgi:hypothetical protein